MRPLSHVAAVFVPLAPLAVAACAGCTKSSSAPVTRPAEVPVEGATDDDSDDATGSERGQEGDESDAKTVDLALAARERAGGGAASGSAFYAEISRELGAVRSTAYTHTTFVDEASGTFDLDCSGFVDYAMARSVPAAFEELRAATVKRPLAKHIVAFLTSLPPSGKGHFRPVTRALDLAPGDLLAWLRPADVVSKNTGHVMVVRGPVVRDRKRDDEVVVPIVDATSLPHGKSDSRKATSSTGIGTGEVLLIVDPSGVPTAYRWSRGRKSREHPTTIAMGRIP